MQRTVVESDLAATRRSLTEAGFDDRQAQTLVDVTGTAAQQRTLQADVAGLKNEVALRNERVDGLRGEFKAFRGEIVARLEASEERVKNEIAELRTDMQSGITELRAETQSDIAELRTEMRSGFAAVHGRIDSLEERLKLMLWFLGIGLTLYTGTTISLMVLLFRNVLS